MGASCGSPGADPEVSIAHVCLTQATPSVALRDPRNRPSHVYEKPEYRKQSFLLRADGDPSRQSRDGLGSCNQPSCGPHEQLH